MTQERDDYMRHQDAEHDMIAMRRPTPPPTPAAGEREAVARALCEARIRTVRRHDTKPEDLEAMLPASIDYSWRDFVAEADAALSALAPIRSAEILAAEARGYADAEREIASWLYDGDTCECCGCMSIAASEVERGEHRKAGK